MKFNLGGCLLLIFIFLNLVLGAAVYTSDIIASIENANFFRHMYNNGYMLERKYMNTRKRWKKTSKRINTVIISEKQEVLYTCYIDNENAHTVIIDKYLKVVYDSHDANYKSKSAEFDEYGELVIKDEYNVG